MTPQQLRAIAEKIALDMNGQTFSDYDGAIWLINQIESALKQVQEDTYNQTKATWEKIRDMAWNGAIDKCVEIASEHNGCVDVKCLSESNCGCTISNQIYALKLSAKGDGK